MSNKRRREQPTVDAELVEIFEDLASENEEIRLKAAKTLLLKALPGADTSSEQLIKILRRLIRGLCSGRKAARLGFSVALTELLVQILGPHGKEFPDLNLGVAELIKILEEQTNVGGSVSGQVPSPQLHRECTLGSCTYFIGGTRPSFWTSIRGRSIYKISRLVSR